MQDAKWMCAVNEMRSFQALDALFADRPETLSVEEVSEMLNVTRQNTYVWLRTGVVPGYKLGSTWRIIRDELKETMRQGANGPVDKGLEGED